MMRFIVTVLLIPLLGCGGGTFFVGVNTASSHVVVASGLVTIVQISVMAGNNGTSVNVTVVTLAANGFANTLTFCGANAGLFPMNSFVQVNFTPAQPCVSSFMVVG